MKKLEHLMIDIETLGTSSNSVITALAAVPFNLDGETGPGFYEKISIRSCTENGLGIDGATLQWWLEQRPEVLKEMLADAKDLDTVVLMFVDYLYQAQASRQAPIAPLSQLKVWCNGAGFDFPIIKHAFNVYAVDLPWKFWNEMDLRTLKNIHPIKLKFEGAKHTALDDCYNQIKLTCRIMNALRQAQDDSPREVAG